MHEEGETGRESEPRFSGGKGTPDEVRRDSIRYWQSQPGEKRIEAILEIRDFYYEVMKPGTGSSRLDRSVGGTRSLRD